MILLRRRIILLPYKTVLSCIKLLKFPYKYIYNRLESTGSLHK